MSGLIGSSLTSVRACALLVLCACALSAACDDESNTARDGGPALDAAAPQDAGALLDTGPPAADAGDEPAGDLRDDFCAPLAAHVCEEADRCGCAALLGGELALERCVLRWTQKCMDGYAPHQQAVELGLARVVRTRARACVGLIDELTPACEVARGTIPGALCEPFVVSDEPLSAACMVPWCAGGDGACVGGTCVPRFSEGSACAEEYECATGLACLNGKCQPLSASAASCQADLECMPPLRCVAGRCAEPAGTGEACADDAACAATLLCNQAMERCEPRAEGACDEQRPCGQGAMCAVERACAARAGESQPCSVDRDCLPSLYCASESSTCVPRPGLDEPCANGVPCAAGLGCDPMATEAPTCLALPRAGQPCALRGFEPLACADGLACFDGVCGPLLGEGERCSSDNRCGEGLACDFTPEGSFCVVPQPLGAPCQNDVVCGPGAHCGSAGTCTSNLAEGDTCTLGGECPPGVCAPDPSGVGFSCRPTPQLGEPCRFEDDCGSELRCRVVPAGAACLPAVCGLL